MGFDIRNFNGLPEPLKFVNGKMCHPATKVFDGYRVPGGHNGALKKRYSQMNAWGMGNLEGISHPVERYYEGQLMLLPEGKMAIVDPMMTMGKTDAPLNTSDSAAFNAIFQSQAVLQVTQSAVYLNAVPHTVWPSSGFRAVITAAITSGVGVAESSDRPDTIEPTYLEIPITPKEGAVATELSDILMSLEDKDDVVTFTVNKEVVESNFLDAWDTDLLQDGDTLADYNMESLDRATMSYAGATALGWTAGDEDLYVDRSTYSSFDGQVSHASGSDRYLTRKLIDAGIRAVQPYWQNQNDFSKKFFLTGFDTQVEWDALEEAKQFLTSGNVQFGMNGVQTMPGHETGVTVVKYKNIPLLLDKNVQSDDIPRIYLVDTDHVGLSFGRPLEILTNDNPFVVGFNGMALFHYIGEARYTKPKSCYSYRDLKN